MKLAIIGGGSSYTPELLSGLIEYRDETHIDTVALYDPAADRLDAVVGFCERMVAKTGVALEVSAKELEAALDGADFVVFQLRVGGQQARHEDILMGWRHDLIGQETTGVGGFAKALRTIPVMLEHARIIEQRSPDAWIINFTNPSGMVTEALCRHTPLKCLGLCNVPIETHMVLSERLGRPRAEIELDWVGLNHLGWLRAVRVDGRDLLPGLIEQVESGEIDTSEWLDVTYPPGFLRQLGALPSSYLRFFYMPDAVLTKMRQAKKTRAQEVMEIEEKLFAAYRDPSVDTLPETLEQRGGAWYSRLAVDVMAALQRDNESIHIVNTPSSGVVKGLAADAVVEVPCRLSRAGVTPIDRGSVDPALLGLMQQVKAYEQLGIDAALTRSRATALKALAAHPLVPNLTQAQGVLDDLVARGFLD